MKSKRFWPLALALVAAAACSPGVEDIASEQHGALTAAQQAKVTQKALSAILGKGAPGFFVAVNAAGVPAPRHPLLAARKQKLAQIKAGVLGGVPNQLHNLVKSYSVLPLLYVRSNTLNAVQAFLGRADVTAVYESHTHRLSTEQTFPAVQQNAVVAYPSFRGQGTTVAVLDTGADWTHADFGTCTAVGSAGCRVIAAQDFAPDDGSRDDLGHGTNVAAIVARAAPRTRIAALDVFEAFDTDSDGVTDLWQASDPDVVDAINWAIDQRQALGIVALNLSLGGGSFTSACGNTTVGIAIGDAADAGIVTVVAAGNDGRDNAVAHPACAPDAVAVGAIYDSGHAGQSFTWRWPDGTTQCIDSTVAADQPTCFSNSEADLLSLLAPGVDVSAGGHTLSGTSMAAPHVSAAVALLRSVHSDATVDDLVNALTASDNISTDPKNSVKTPVLDVVRSVVSISPHRAAVEGAMAGYYSDPSDLQVLNVLGLMHEVKDITQLKGRIVAPLLSAASSGLL